MAASRISVALARSFKVLVIFPLIATGLAATCAAAPLMCLSFLTVPSPALDANDHADARFHLPGAQHQRWSELWIDAATGLAGVPDRLADGSEFASFESRFASLQTLLHGNLASAANGPQPGIQFIRFDVPTLAPMAFTRFCLEYPADCEPQRLSLGSLFGGDRTELNPARWSELEAVNRAVNASIHPERNEEGLAGEKWLLSPARGDCNDYAVTKRHELIARGWPARNLLLSEVVTVTGEHHLVTVVRTTGGDWVLDNLTDQIMPWSRTPYRWVRIQMPRNPNYWASISAQNA